MDLLVPVMPNAPLVSLSERESFGRIALRRNDETEFVENAAFDAALLSYGARYQNSQAHSAAFGSHMQEVCAILEDRYRHDSRIVEVGCGKGDFIDVLERNGFRNVFGFDAAYEGARANIERRYLTAADRMPADLLVLRHVVEHVQRPHRFLEMLCTVFGPDCEVYVEVPCLDWILDQGAFFDITYEHVNYFNARSLRALLGDELLGVGTLFGRQYLYATAKLGARGRADFERAYDAGIWRPLQFFKLFPQLERRLQDIREMLRDGRRAYVWGAATKGCQFLYFFLDRFGEPGSVPFAVDINPNKVGKFLPGSKTPIVAKEELFRHARTTDLLIVSNPNYLAEISAEIAGTRLAAMQIVCI